MVWSNVYCNVLRTPSKASATFGTLTKHEHECATVWTCRFASVQSMVILAYLVFVKLETCASRKSATRLRSRTCLCFLQPTKIQLQAPARFSWQKPAQRHVPSIEQPRYFATSWAMSHLDSRLDMPLHYSYILPDGGKKQKSNLSCWEPLPRWSQSRTKRQFQLRDQLWHAQLGCLLFCRRGDSLQLQPQAFESGRLCAIVCASDCWDLKVMCKSPRIVKNCCTLIYSIYYPLPLLSPEVDL